MIVNLPVNNEIRVDVTSRTEAQFYMFVIDSIVTIYKKLIPNVDASKLLIINNENASNPVIFKEQNLIILNTKYDLWCQVAYQFSHEFCHFIIGDGVTDKMRWFEESICEMSSHFVLRNLFTSWENAPPIYSSYRHNFLTYSEDNFKNIFEFDMKSYDEQCSLESDCYQRKKNRYVASKLLIIFNEHPELWCALSALSKLPPTSSFHESLVSWLINTPAPYRNGLLKIVNLFSRQ